MLRSLFQTNRLFIPDMKSWFLWRSNEMSVFAGTNAERWCESNNNAVWIYVKFVWNVTGVLFHLKMGYFVGVLYFYLWFTSILAGAWVLLNMGVGTVGEIDVMVYYWDLWIHFDFFRLYMLVLSNFTSSAGVEQALQVSDRYYYHILATVPCRK